MEDGEKTGASISGFSFSAVILWAGRQCGVPRRCLEGDAGERGQNKRKRPGEDKMKTENQTRVKDERNKEHGQ